MTVITGTEGLIKILEHLSRMMGVFDQKNLKGLTNLLEWGNLGSPAPSETGAVRRGPADGEGDRGVGRAVRPQQDKEWREKGSGGHCWSCGLAKESRLKK